MDPLVETIALLRPEALLWKEMDVRGDWAIRFPASSALVFAMVASGRCVFQMAGREPCEMREGDFVLLKAPEAWRLGRDTDSRARDFTPSPARGARTFSLNPGEAGPVTRILGGRFDFAQANSALLEHLLPPVVAIRALDGGAVRLRHVLDLLGDEAIADRPGRALVMQRLLELMLVETMRTHLSSSGTLDTGLIAGLGDAKVARALQAMHADVQKRWTVGQLAQVAGMSRSMFAARFGRIVGLSPIDYLLRWRMALARHALQSRSAGLKEIAEQTGYLSVSAFSTAFARTVGCPPSAFARRTMPVDAS
ncbi:MAG: AraC family transcriptional regulator [Polaromonas sp.]|nr:AraC family transcriptional regulator [Polaromonas sp.]